jgi:hypothetical protein
MDPRLREMGLLRKKSFKDHRAERAQEAALQADVPADFDRPAEANKPQMSVAEQ